MDARDVDVLYAELLGEPSTLPPGDVEPPMDKPWDQREFHVRLPDGNWLAFGQPVRPAHQLGENPGQSPGPAGVSGP